MKQLPLGLIGLEERPCPEASYLLLDDGAFSHGLVNPEAARHDLENRYREIFEETERFSRQTVSYQANKAEILHRWFKYREGFSADLVQIFLTDYGLTAGQVVLDPFAGSSTTLLQAKISGCDAIGIELLPHCKLIWDAKARLYDYNAAELRHILTRLERETPPRTCIRFPHLGITQSAFPETHERELMGYQQWFAQMEISEAAKTLLRALLMGILEDVSYTRKDGQYLRWDARAEKIRARNKTRIAQGKKPVHGIDKGPLPSVRDALISSLTGVLRDIRALGNLDDELPTTQTFIEGNVLFELPKLPPESVDLVVTSPPYANRYDYTRTYALELAFLEVGQRIFDLRQAMLSCTVENQPKDTRLVEYYAAIDALSRYERAVSVATGNKALLEVHAALRTRQARGDINNKGVLRMIDQYFRELALVFTELLRVCKPGAHVVFVNDNVRYAGEVVPVDTITTAMAESIGFAPEKIYVIPQRKGNSSQQMKKFGRQSLRKSLTVWRKPG